MKNKIIGLLMAAAAALPAGAQEFRSAYFMQTSTTRHELNPALLDESFVTMPLLPLGYLNIGTTGNVGLSNFVYKMGPDWQGYGEHGNTLTTFMHPNVDRADFLNGLKDNNRMSVSLKYQLAGVAFKGFGGYNVIDLSLRSNSGAAVPKSLFAFMKDTGEEDHYKISNMGLRSENYLELGLGHSHKIDDKLTVGGKVKLLWGLGYADFDAENINVNLADGTWQIDGNAKLTAAVMKTDLKYNDNPDKMKDGRRRFDGIDDFKGGLAGFGLAFDLGATYKVLDELTVSASLTDLGFINWSTARQATSQGTWTFDGFKHSIPAGGSDPNAKDLQDQWDDIQDDLEDVFSLYEDGAKGQTRALAATLNLGAEYTLPAYDKLRFGFLYTSRIAGKYSHHQGMFAATVRPLRWIEATANMAFTSTGVTGGLTVDLRARHFNFFVGTDRFFGKLGKQGIPINRANANVALGMSFPL